MFISRDNSTIELRAEGQLYRFEIDEGQNLQLIEENLKNNIPIVYVQVPIHNQERLLKILFLPKDGTSYVYKTRKIRYLAKTKMQEMVAQNKDKQFVTAIPVVDSKRVVTATPY